jgi:hypothetical protein
MVNPIKPEEVVHTIPDFIIEAVNTLIKKKWDGKKALIKQDDILAIVSSNNEDSDKPSRRTIFDNNWLDFEDIYREVGWKVEYDKPAYNESYDAYFKFTKK